MSEESQMSEVEIRANLEQARSSLEKAASSLAVSGSAFGVPERQVMLALELARRSVKLLEAVLDV